jgi:hypothetical protein
VDWREGRDEDWKVGAGAGGGDLGWGGGGIGGWRGVSDARGGREAGAEAGGAAGVAVRVLRGDVPERDADRGGPGELLGAAERADAGQAAAPLLPRLRVGGVRGLHSAQLHGHRAGGEGRARQRHARNVQRDRRHQSRRRAPVPLGRLLRRHPRPRRRQFCRPGTPNSPPIAIAANPPNHHILSHSTNSLITKKNKIFSSDADWRTHLRHRLRPPRWHHVLLGRGHCQRSPLHHGRRRARSVHGPRRTRHQRPRCPLR